MARRSSMPTSATRSTIWKASMPMSRRGRHGAHPGLRRQFLDDPAQSAAAVHAGGIANEPPAAPDRRTQMKSIRTLFAALAAFLALAAAPACATDEHDYARDEYAIIRDGLAPNRQMSLASHADPESDGHGTGHNFHVWLMAEPAHRKLARLPDIGPNALLDTGPNAYRTYWSA